MTTNNLSYSYSDSGGGFKMKPNSLPFNVQTRSLISMNKKHFGTIHSPQRGVEHAYFNTGGDFQRKNMLATLPKPIKKMSSSHYQATSPA